MSDETPKKAPAKKKELSIEEQVEQKLREEARLRDIELFTAEKRKEIQDEKNHILVRKAFEGGLDNAPAIGKKIGMSENGVKRYAAALGITLRLTDAEKQRAYQDAIRATQEEAEKMKYGIKGPQ